MQSSSSYKSINESSDLQPVALNSPINSFQEEPFVNQQDEEPSRTMNTSWLLRLFQSDFFNPWIAVSYLFKYQDEVGIQYYLCDEMRKFPLDEVLFFLPQLCHMLIQYPSKVTALEKFLLELCSKSSHVNILMNWYLEAYLQDLKDQKTEISATCRRIHEHCLLELFKWRSETSPGLRSPQSQLAQWKPKAKPSLDAHLVGIGCIMGALASPVATKDAFSMVLSQGMVTGEESTYLDASNSFTYLSNVLEPNLSIDPNMHALVSPVESVRKMTIRRSFSAWFGRKDHQALVPTKPIFAPPSVEDLNAGNAFSFDRYLTKARSLPYLSHKEVITLKSAPKFDASFDSEVGQEVVPNEKPRKSIMERYYFHTEMQFVNSLVDICEKLCHIPKASRQGSLTAELAVLNHNLPASVCIPLWCRASLDIPVHHQIVRIPPEEAVILNSADRVPYLIMLEVIEPDEWSSLESNPSEAGLSCIDSNRPIIEDLKSSFPDSHISSPQSSHHLMAKQELGSKNSPLPIECRDDLNERMKSAGIMLAQLNASRNNINSAVQQQIRDKILEEMIALEDARILRVSTQNSIVNVLDALEVTVAGDDDEERKIMENIGKMIDDPSAAVFKEKFEEKVERIRKSSPYGGHSKWRLYSVIVKSGADLRQEQLACQLIREIKSIWEAEHVPLWVHYFRVLITSDSSGLIETIQNAISVHSLKKDAYARHHNKPGKRYDLFDHFINTYGPVESREFQLAQDAFMRSLAGYSLVTYILSLKDRHNGNILLDREGHLSMFIENHHLIKTVIVHIDFGFMLGNSPGSVGFESAAFKITQDYIDVLGGTRSHVFAEFRALLFRGLVALRKHADKIILLVEMMMTNSKFPCFGSNPQTTLQALRSRFHTTLTDQQTEQLLDKLLTSSCNNVFTRLYDVFQYQSNGIL